MAQDSLMWTTGTTGDGSTTYTQDELTEWIRNFFGTGVIIGVGGQLAVTGASGSVDVAAGAASAYGFPYTNTSTVNLPVPAAVLGTTGHRVVLRVTWGTTRTVRLALLSSSDGVSSIPAVTQNPGTLYEISLATLTRQTNGTITVTDTRSYTLYGGVAQAVLDQSISTGKLSIGIPFLQSRVGGSSTDWAQSGTTIYTPSTRVAQIAGVTQWNGGGPSFLNGQVVVAIPSGFTGRPIVQVTQSATSPNISSQTKMRINTYVSSATAFTIYWDTDYVSGFNAVDFHWSAVGPI